MQGNDCQKMDMGSQRGEEGNEHVRESEEGGTVGSQGLENLIERKSTGMGCLG